MKPPLQLLSTNETLKNIIERNYRGHKEVEVYMMLIDWKTRFCKCDSSP
jgi:hypothetical protein